MLVVAYCSVHLRSGNMACMSVLRAISDKSIAVWNEVISVVQVFGKKLFYIHVI